mmetsp:Transcript_43826/g.42322  ORF Transcript_43826/g.42322 Transcript_43826/m.42322 type:complete len:127 (+) Transcript_43826:641-1021(+)
METILRMTEIEFVTPEEVILNQGDDLGLNSYMYFIEKGECIVKVKDKSKLRNTEKFVRKLYPSECFGEIAMIYRERRTTSVSSNNYTSLGKIQFDKVTELFLKYPEFKQILIDKIKFYYDSLTLFF